MRAWGNSYFIVATIDKYEVKVEVNSVVIGGAVDVVHEGQKYILVGCVEKDSCGPSKVNIEANREASGAISIDSLNEEIVTGMK